MRQRFKEELPDYYRGTVVKDKAPCTPLVSISLTQEKPKRAPAVVVRARPVAPTMPAAKTNRRLRPSLSEQLANIGNRAEEITQSIVKRHGLEQDHGQKTGGLLFSMPSQQFTVGRVDCKFPSPVQFYSNKCAYTFHHPFSPKEIHMHMYYRDMQQVAIRGGGLTLAFKVMKQLEQFGLDYQAAHPHHFVQITFVSKTAMQRVRQLLKQKQILRI